MGTFNKGQIVVFSLALFILVIAAYRFNLGLLYVAALFAVSLSVISESPLQALVPYMIIITWGAEVWDEAYPLLYTIVKESILAIFIIKCVSKYRPKDALKAILIVLLFITYCFFAEYAHNRDEIEYMKLVNLGVCYFCLYLCSKYGGYQDFKVLSAALSWGVILSGIIALISIFIPPLFEVVNKMIQTTNEFDLMEVSTGRFAAMTYDPNQFGLYAMIPLSSNLVIIIREKYQRVGYEFLLTIGLFIFSFITLSKAVFLFLGLLLLYFVYIILSGGRLSSDKKIIIIFVLVVLSIVAVNELSIYFDAMKLRFSDSGSVSRATTGRSDLWAFYLDQIFEDIRILLFGNSLIGRLPNRSTPHNFIIYMLFFFGILGSIVYSLMMYFILNVKKTRIGREKVPFLYKLPILLYFLFSLTIDPFMLYDVKLSLIGISLISLASCRNVKETFVDYDKS